MRNGRADDYLRIEVATGMGRVSAAQQVEGEKTAAVVLLAERADFRVVELVLSSTLFWTRDERYIAHNRRQRRFVWQLSSLLFAVAAVMMVTTSPSGFTWGDGHEPDELMWTRRGRWSRWTENPRAALSVELASLSVTMSWCVWNCTYLGRLCAGCTRSPFGSVDRSALSLWRLSMAISTRMIRGVCNRRALLIN